MTKPPHLDAVVIPCRDINRQRAFYERVLEGAPAETGSGWLRFDLGHVSLALRARGDALFPREGQPGVMLAFHLESRDEVERWHRRLLMAKVAVLDPPAPLPSGEFALHAADPEGNVLCLFAS